MSSHPSQPTPTEDTPGQFGQPSPPPPALLPPRYQPDPSPTFGAATETYTQPPHYPISIRSVPPAYGPDPEIQRKLYVQYRSRLRKTYGVPLLTWIPSFGFILYYAIANEVKGKMTPYTWVAVVLWVMMLFAIIYAYHTRFKRLTRVFKMGILDSLPIDELNDVVMHGAPLRSAPDYDETAVRYDEPLPLYPARRTESSSSRGTTQSWRRWWTGETTPDAETGPQQQSAVPMTDLMVEGSRERAGSLSSVETKVMVLEYGTAEPKDGVETDHERDGQASTSSSILLPEPQEAGEIPRSVAVHDSPAVSPPL
ncbi:uncharacterized protein SPPG_00708 [Spizellomyces punctatus DAOM BR117]|uniref:Uncharacterized protein n=1 Tax=Spizellomyces punctatus (strain DAOM BR117) TaxID=645134 RepID=A0A0L0HVX7_SPIPD|nr:uncharacterized protein SPPG_00708 [Spizellomyces punctatus DAOM BR117]KND05029.1 hypothetical protein SPPG_00708 [Spizellomyces punctatus DAOM BR117]|eukprot:XP_016613068.1 hypothetical protein SPPG_00708 [Spizellomyces punctatus DAOM BR117]